MENRAQFLKGVARTLVLRLLRERPMYGYEIATALAARSEGVFALGQGTLYPLLYSLEKKGLIRVSREEEAAGAGRRRCYYTLTPAARASLDKLLNEREDRTYTHVTVTGHTDSVGNDAANLALSKRRAETVASYLKAHGLKAQAVSVTGRGSADPVASNATAEGRASNRRVEISLQR